MTRPSLPALAHPAALPAAGLLQSDALSAGLPPGYIHRAGLVALVVDLIALASIWRSRQHSLKAKLVWTVIVAVVPVVGGVAWSILGRERRRPPSTGA